MVKHHPDSNTLAEYSARSLPAAQSVCVATHLDHCTVCQQKLAQLESIGGVMLEDTAPVSVDPQVFEDVLLRLDEVPDDRAANDANASTLSWTIKQVRQGNLDKLQWKKVSRSLRIADLGRIDGAAEFSLYHISEGGRIEKPATFTRQQRFRVVIAFVLLCSRHPCGLPIGIIVG